MHYTLMHISDLHAGPPFSHEIAHALTNQAHSLRPDALIISGDLVQRAVMPGQWRTIKAFLARLPQPQLVVAGNHDVPLVDGFSRLLAPMSYYRRHITPDLNPVLTFPGLVIAGGNSAYGLTTDGGHVSRQQRRRLEEILTDYGPDTCKIAVMHHPLVDPPIGRRKARIRNARAVIELLARCDVELYLSGHMHFSFIAAVTSDGMLADSAYSSTPAGWQMVVCQSGTTTSRRGRPPDRRKNSFNIIHVSDTMIRIQPYFYEPAQQHFVPLTEQVFARYRPRQSDHPHDTG